MTPEQIRLSQFRLEHGIGYYVRETEPTSYSRSVDAVMFHQKRMIEAEEQRSTQKPSEENQPTE